MGSNYTTKCSMMCPRQTASLSPAVNSNYSKPPPPTWWVLYVYVVCVWARISYIRYVQISKTRPTASFCFARYSHDTSHHHTVDVHRFCTLSTIVRLIFIFKWWYPLPQCSYFCHFFYKNWMTKTSNIYKMKGPTYIDLFNDDGEYNHQNNFQKKMWELHHYVSHHQ